MTPSPTGIEMGAPLSDNFEAAFEALGAGHGNGPDPVVPEMLLHLERHLGGLVLDFVVDGQGVIDRGQSALETRRPRPDREPLTILPLFISYLLLKASDPRMISTHPAWPPAISSNSLVILPWRSLLYSRVKSLIRLSALSVAFFIETMRALCSLALAFSRT